MTTTSEMSLINWYNYFIQL